MSENTTYEGLQIRMKWQPPIVDAARLEREREMLARLRDYGGGAD